MERSIFSAPDCPCCLQGLLPDRVYCLLLLAYLAVESPEVVVSVIILGLLGFCFSIIPAWC